MKIRSGFVSNSSSSSFIILKEYLTDLQIDMIKNHIEIAKKVDKESIKNSKDFDVFLYEYYEDWNVIEDEISLHLYTFMDNFDMKAFLENEVKFNIDKIIFEEDGHFWGTPKPKDYQKFKLNYLRKKKINIIIKNLK